MLKRICLMRHIMKIANRFRLTFPAALAAVVAGGSAVAAPKDEPIAEISTSLGDFAVRLDAQRAPITVANFIRYADEGFYDGTIFHRVISGFMIQGGGFEPGLKQKQTKAPIENEANNGLKNDKYTIAMARTNEPHSATSQFFINVADNDFLNHTSPTSRGWGYAVFGKVVSGTDVIDAIARVRTASRSWYGDVPVEDVVMEKVEEI